ncbi:Fanconi anemia group M protein [Danio aesculapii]|uniref:Fanconi anemia group M protein n=1 Tax=Danio aesculapii TaxID=1142201 RepID=UPI0024C0D1CB|nr:Fanconi anemia group M protein [Danio aesculapii]
MSGAQRTLFQAWGHSGAPKTSSRSPQQPEIKPYAAAAAEDDEDDDDVLLVAVCEAERSVVDLGFDSSAGRVWIYPTNLPLREYQLRVCEAALLQNTLVCLPTGLGKTFIASVLMYNYYRWFPAGKIVFMAPTKPLVAQQIEACYRVMGIPQEHTAELTGSTAAPQRRSLWSSRRVFFLTPQVMVNDLCRNTCPAAQVRCVVIDEAHKATGNHAYCQVIRELCKQTQQFRVLALSATPGGDVKAVQQVISNLLISHIELRSEDSPDVQTHVHQRSLEKMVVPLGESLTHYQTRYLQVLERFSSRLTQMRLLNQRDLRSLSKYQIILAREQFRRNPPPHIQGPQQQGVLEGDFALLISLYHGFELLLQMGIRSLFLFIQNFFTGPRESARVRNELQRCSLFMELYREMENMFNTASRGPEEPYVYTHPKLQKLDEVVLRHFQTCAGSSDGSAVNTRVMIFSSYRESVQEIAEMLNRHQPLVRVMTFMGQASAGRGVRGFTQKEQLEVVRRFREGGFNTLVSTCVGEEGLDIGEVDLIVCFDAQKSPIRLVQRMGRTGRQRQGRIVVILAEGREERTYNQSQSNRRSVNKSIMGNKHSFQMFSDSPRMLPADVTPALHKMNISCAQQFQHRDSGRRSSRSRRSSLTLNNTAGADQRCVKQDWSLSSAEQAVWSSSMRLSEDEAQPVFRPSNMLSFSEESPPLCVSGVCVSGECVCVSRPLRELSLWEWRHWQNRPLHTHRVQHSERCLHFTAIMELIDTLRHQEEGDCSFQSELMKHLQMEDVEGGQTKTTNNIPQQRTTSSTEEQVNTTPAAHTQGAPLQVQECVSITDDDDDAQTCSSVECVECLLDGQEDESSDLQHIFYQPELQKTRRCRHSLNSRRFLEIIRNVEQLLCRSPPKLLEEEEPLSETFRVSFSLTSALEDPEDDEDEDTGVCAQNTPPSAAAAASPGWDELFDDGDGFMKAEERQEDQLSLDLFDDEEFLQMSIPDVQTPDNSTGPDGEQPEQKQQTLADVPGGRSTLTGPEGEQQSPVSVSGSRLNVTGPDRKQRTPLNVSGSRSNLTGPDGEQSEQKQCTLTDCSRRSSVTGPDGEQATPVSVSGSTLNLTGPNRKQRTPLNVSGTRLNLTGPEGEQRTPVYVTRSRSNLTGPDGKQETDGSRSRSSLTGPEGEQESPVNVSRSRSSLTGPEGEQAAGGSGSSCVFRCSQDFFSVNFDLGFESESEEEAAAGAGVSGMTSELPPLTSDLCSAAPRPSASTPNHLYLPAHRRTHTPGQRRRTCTGVFVSDSEDEAHHQGCSALEMAPVFSPEVKQQVCSDVDSPLQVCRKRPAINMVCSDVDSPLRVCRKRTAALNTSEGSEGDDVLQLISVHQPGCHRSNKKCPRGAARQFLDEEAELSEDEDEDVSSDEDDGDEQNQSLQGFVVNNTQCSQGLNDSEMQAFYLKSVRSPALQKPVRMTYKPKHSINIFSQVPEQDESYAEDSFVVDGSEEEDEESADEESVELIPEDSIIDGRRQYATRRRARIRQIRAANTATDQQRRKKRSRIIRPQDSSDEDEDRPQTHTVFKVPQSVCRQPELEIQKRQRLEDQAELSEELDFQTHKQAPDAGLPVSADAPLAVLVDARCISGGSELLSLLRLRHHLQVHVCSLGSADFIISNRTAVEWQSESEVSSAHNRRRLLERMQRLQATYERVCLIIQKDRTRPGEMVRVFQHSRYYDSTLAALVTAGVRLLFSNGFEETAAILTDLTQVEKRKGQAIQVPLEVKGHRQQALQFYLTLPNMSYICALNMSHRFSSISHMISSSVEDLQASACVSRSRAEEIYRCLRYSCDPVLINQTNQSRTTIDSIKPD